MYLMMISYFACSGRYSRIVTMESEPDTAESDDEEVLVAFMPRHMDRHRAHKDTELVRQDLSHRDAREALFSVRDPPEGAFQQGQPGCFSDL